MATRKKSKAQVAPGCLPVLNPKVAGVDLGSREHWVCGPARPDEKPNVRVFRTVTPQLEELASWLIEEGVTSVAMESTSVYWIPVYELLESKGIEVLLVNARQISNVPGRKTDMKDCQWLQLLHSCVLIAHFIDKIGGSFRPNESICRLRALKRQSANLVSERTKAVQWMQKALDQMNVQVHHAVSDLTGKTGLAIIRAIVGGERDPLELARLRDCRCRKSAKEIAEHLSGNWRSEHLFNLRMALKLFEQLQDAIDEYEIALTREIEAITPDDRKVEDVPPHPNVTKERALRRRGDQPLRSSLWRFSGVDLTRVDGIGPEAALVLLTEAGLDLSSFPTERHFCSWLQLAPRTSFSAGKPLRKKRNAIGSTRIAIALRMAALGVGKTKTAMGASFRRLSRLKGKSTAVFATARRLATLAFRMLRYGQDYIDIGEQAFEERFRQSRIYGLTASAKELGYELVPLKEAA